MEDKLHVHRLNLNPHTKNPLTYWSSPHLIYHIAQLFVPGDENCSEFGENDLLKTIVVSLPIFENKWNDKTKRCKRDSKKGRLKFRNTPLIKWTWLQLNNLSHVSLHSTVRLWFVSHQVYGTEKSLSEGVRRYRRLVVDVLPRPFNCRMSRNVSFNPLLVTFQFIWNILCMIATYVVNYIWVCFELLYLLRYV